MKRLPFLLLTLFLFLHTNLAFANGTSGYVSIQNKDIQIISDGSPRAFIYNVVINNGGCNQTTPVLLMDDSQVLSKEIYSTLLTAKATGQAVNLVTGGCWEDFPVIFSIYLGN